MPKTKSTQKALAASRRRHAYNLSRKKQIQEIEKVFQKAVGGNDKIKAQSLLPQLYQAYDKAAKRKVISKQKADRKKGQAAVLLNRVK